MCTGSEGAWGAGKGRARDWGEEDLLLRVSLQGEEKERRKCFTVGTEGGKCHPQKVGMDGTWVGAYLLTLGRSDQQGRSYAGLRKRDPS